MLDISCKKTGEEEALASVLSANWDFGGNMDEQELEGFINVDNFLFDYNL